MLGVLAHFEVFCEYFVKHQERNEETESLRIGGYGGIVIGSSLKFQNSKIAKLIRKNWASKRNERNDASNDVDVQPESIDQGQTV